MSLDADLIVDRRRMRRKLTFWRVIAIGVIVLAVAGVAVLGSKRARLSRLRALIPPRPPHGLDRRHLSDDQLQTVSDGRSFTGHQAIALKLIDELGDERAAIAWLAKEKNVDAKLPVRDYELRSRVGDLPFLHAAVVALLDATGLTTLAHRLDDWGMVAEVERFNLDGLLALWHPAAAN